MGVCTVKTALQLILALSVIGAVAAAILVYQDVSAHSCGLCKLVPRKDLILGYPSCYYALALYVLTAAAAAWGLRARR